MGVYTANGYKEFVFILNFFLRGLRDFLRELCKTEERKQLDRIHDFFNQMNQVKQEKLVSNKSKPLHTRAKILEIVLDGEEIKIIKDRTEKLSEEHKAKMKELIETLM